MWGNRTWCTIGSSAAGEPVATAITMVTVTEIAKKELQRILQSRELDPGRFLRLTTPPVWEGDGDFGIVIDEEGEGDQVVHSEGLTLLLVESSLAEQLAKAVLDFKESPAGSRFTLDVF